MNDLVAGIQFRNDEVHRRPVGQHAVAVCILIRTEAWKRRQQPVMQIDDPPAREPPAGSRRKHPHVPRQNDVVHVVAVGQFDDPVVVRIAARVGNVVPVDAELLRHAPAGIAVADHDRRRGPQAAVANRPQDREGRFRSVGRADRQTRRP